MSRPLALRVAEAVLFAAEEPLDEATVQEHLSPLPEPAAAGPSPASR